VAGRGLPNRYLLDDRVQQALYQTRREGGATLLALLDLDDFRFLNETLGPDRGDGVLQEVAGRLRRHLRRTDTLARLDGDTFAVLLAHLPYPRAALPVLDKIRATVADPFHDRGATLRLSATLGVELYPEGAKSATELMEHAQAALEQAKEHERGAYRFYRQGFDAAMRERAGLEREFRRAVLEDQLVLHYQPRVELQTGSITSVEALVRWAHPERGLLKPAQFVPLAEEARLGGELFDWVLERACAQAKRWQQQRTSRRVAVNVSPQALEDEDFTKRVQETLTRYDLHPGLLEIEINERTGGATLEAADGHLQLLRSMGVRISLDDFGVAHASLSQLRGMPLDGLKIDRSFVGRLGARDVGEDVEVVRAIIALGKSLRLTVTAEGIETREQNSLLRTLACDEGQGFLFSQAVPAEYVPAFA
jgi:diguanylate cyclase (GGDEF)-like protein